MPGRRRYRMGRKTSYYPMLVKKAELTNYRNYESLGVAFSPGTNLLFGDNGQGKTNLLEAIYLCATTASHRGKKEKELIAFNKEEAHIRLLVEKRGVESRLDFHISREKGKSAALEGVPLPRIAAILGQLHVVFFSPEDLQIIKRDPEERRRFLNLEMCQLSPAYTADLMEYKKLLQNRNALLKDIREKGSERSLLNIYDEKLAEAGESLMKARAEFLKELEEIIRPIHYALSGGKEELSLRYQRGAPEGQMAEKLFLSRDRDLALGSTSLGPHRDEIGFFINERGLKQFGSQGQQRTAALALKLGEIEMVRRKIGESPVLLLDDVLSELDSGRQEKLLSSLQNMQTILTCTGLEDWVKGSLPVEKKWRVREGTLTEEDT